MKILEYGRNFAIGLIFSLTVLFISEMILAPSEEARLETERLKKIKLEMERKALVEKGANVAILGKTKEPHPKLENTIDTAVEKLLTYANLEHKPTKRYEISDISKIPYTNTTKEYEKTQEERSESLDKWFN